MATDIKVREADLYFIAPLHIIDYDSFKAGLINAGWVCPSEVRFSLYDEDSISETTASFLGMLKQRNESGVMNGECFLLPSKPAPDSILGQFREVFYGKDCLMTFSSKKHKETSSVWADEMRMGEVLRVHIAPDRATGLVVVHFRRPQFKDGKQVSPVPIQTIESTNYWLHKTDDQAPSIIINGSFFLGCKTLLDILSVLCGIASNVAVLMDRGRFITATYIQLVVPNMKKELHKNEFYKEVDNRILHIGQSKSASYEIVETATQKTHLLFENIRVSLSSEGFCGGFLVKEGEENTKFMAKSSTAFLKSYLPIYLEVLMLDCMSLGFLDGNSSADGSSCLYECLTARVGVADSRYVHLRKLKEISLAALSVPEKAKLATASLDRNEKVINSRIDSLLKYTGVGTLLLAILRFIGMNNVFGVKFSSSILMRIVSISCVCCLIAFIIAVLIRVIPSLRSLLKYVAGNDNGS